MRPLPFIWPYALPFWAAFLWAYGPESGIIRRARRAAGTQDAKSVEVIAFGQGIAVLAAWPFAWVRALQFPVPRTAAFFAGVAMLIAGSLLRRHCRRMLGSSFTGEVRASADQQVVTRGAYALLRHPSYSAGLLMNAGVGVALGNWASAGILVLGTLAAYVYRIGVEERVLLATIGEPYRPFMATRKRLVPFVY